MKKVLDVDKIPKSTAQNSTEKKPIMKKRSAGTVNKPKLEKSPTPILTVEQLQEQQREHDLPLRVSLELEVWGLCPCDNIH